MKGDRLHLPYNLSTNHKNAVDFFEELCIIEKEANSVSAKLFFRTCKVFFGRRGRIWKDNLTDEVSLGSQSRAWLVPCLFVSKWGTATARISESTKQTRPSWEIHTVLTNLAAFQNQIIGGPHWPSWFQKWYVSTEKQRIFIHHPWFGIKTEWYQDCQCQ